MILADFGEPGQRRLSASHAAVLGCGALGTVASEQLARAGVGRITIIDRDVVEWTNLQRQTLFDERHAAEGTPKAVAAAERMRLVNSSIQIEPIVADVRPGNIESLLNLAASDGLAPRAGVVIDATDNFQTRYLLNDVCVKHALPWVYGGAIGTRGMQATFLPALGGACLRCAFPVDSAAPIAGGDTCDTVGVLAGVAGIVASCQAIEALKILLGRADLCSTTLLDMDPWKGERRRVDLASARDPRCPCCVQRRFEFLERRDEDLAMLCGRDAVQISARISGRDATPPFDLGALARRLQATATVQQTPWLVRAKVDPHHELTVFSDGRAIVRGTTDPGRARSLYARFVGV